MEVLKPDSRNSTHSREANASKLHLGTLLKTKRQEILKTERRRVSFPLREQQSDLG